MICGTGNAHRGAYYRDWLAFIIDVRRVLLQFVLRLVRCF